MNKKLIAMVKSMGLLQESEYIYTRYDGIYEMACCEADRVMFTGNHKIIEIDMRSGTKIHQQPIGVGYKVKSKLA